MSDGTCNHCSQWSRHPCRSREEAVECGNLSSSDTNALLGELLDDNQVAGFLEGQAEWKSVEEAVILRQAAKIVRGY